MFLKNRKIISKMKRSKVTDYAALKMNKILSTRQINSKTHQYAATLLKVQVVYVSICIALCLTVSLKVLEGNIIRHKIFRMLKFHPITAFMKTYPYFKNIFD